MKPALAWPALLLALSACGSGQFPDGIPVYVGENRVTTLNAPAGGGGAADPATECQRLAQRTADPSLNDFQRQAAANYAASLGC